MVKKRFDKELYEQNDAMAKALVALILPKNLELKNNENRYGVDLLAYKSNKLIFYIEPEIKRVWNDEKFKYEDLQIPQRKNKFCDLENPTLFIIFNKLGNRYLCVWSNDLINCPLKEVPNKYVYKGELFYKVPISLTYDNINKAVKNKP